MTWKTVLLDFMNICEKLLIIVPTRPCINYSVSLEAVVWDGEQEEAFQYESVKSMIIIIWMTNFYHGDSHIKKSILENPF